jgi:hypothetical protein
MGSTGLYGRKPALIPAGLHDLTYYTAGSLPKAPAKVAVPSVPNPGDGTLWGMQGNASYGNCGVAGLVHGQMAVASILGTKGFAPPAPEQTVSYYLDYTKGKDSGVILSQFLQFVQKQPQGMLGEMVDSYAPVKVQDIPALQYTIDAYDFAYVGITVTEGMEQASQDEQPWTLETLLSPVAGGHCIVLVGYDSQYLYGITWGAVQAIPYSTWHYIGDEAWAVISGYESKAGNDGRGINYAALKADLSKLAA